MRLLVKNLLTQAAYDHSIQKWSLQGFGMFRLYLSKSTRLHVWSPKHAYADVDTIHTHPWSFTSHIINGSIHDIPYGEASTGRAYKKQLIVCGPGGGACDMSKPEEVLIRAGFSQIFRGGSSYSKKAEDIHESQPSNGCISIIERRFRPDTEHAYVYWPAHRDWHSAEPRAATGTEIVDMARHALDELEYPILAEEDER